MAEDGCDGDMSSDRQKRRNCDPSVHASPAPDHRINFMEALVKFATVCTQPVQAAEREFDETETASILRCVEIIEASLEEFVASLGLAGCEEETRATLPRNRRGWVQSQQARAEIRGLLQRHSAATSPLTAKQIQRSLTRPLSERTIQWHMQNIRTEHNNTLRLAQFNTLPS